MAIDFMATWRLILNAPVPGWLARWMPSFMLASPSECRAVDRAKERLEA